MIIVKLMGGLGNQMFQYAIGRHLACKNQTALKLDISSYKSNKKRHYNLGCFNIVGKIATPEEINKIIGKHTKLGEKFYKKVQKLKPLSRRRFFREPYPQFYKNVFKLRGNIYLKGYWQSEKYFKDIENIIRKELTLKLPLTDKNKTIAKQIDECDSIGLHIRRGDYISSPSANKILGVCPPEYYYRAVKQISEKIRKPVFFVFSDEIDWAKKNLKLSYPAIYLDHNGLDKNYEDLRLMTICRHNIITNSTFSWWGAWLNSNKNKIVFAPQKWFNDRSRNINDLIPKSWIRI